MSVGRGAMARGGVGNGVVVGHGAAGGWGVGRVLRGVGEAECGSRRGWGHLGGCGMGPHPPFTPSTLPPLPPPPHCS